MVCVFLRFMTDICIKVTKTVQTTPQKASPAAGMYSLRCTIFPPAIYFCASSREQTQIHVSFCVVAAAAAV